MGKCWERSFLTIKIGKNTIIGNKLSSDANTLIDNSEGTFVGAIEISEEFDNEKRGKYSWSSELAIITLDTSKNMYIVTEYVAFSQNYTIPPYEQESDFYLANINYLHHNFHTKELIKNLMNFDTYFKNYFTIYKHMKKCKYTDVEAYDHDYEHNDYEYDYDHGL